MKRTKTRRKQRKHSAPEPIIIPSPVPPPGPSGGNPFLFLLLCGAGFYFLQTGHPGVGMGLFALALLPLLRARILPEPRYQSLTAWTWVAGFFLVLVAFLNVPDLRVCMPPDTPVGPENTRGYFWLGCALMTGGFAWFRPVPEWRNMGRASAWTWFVVIMAVAAYLRLSHFHDPAAFYWDDYALAMVDSKSALDIPRERYLVFPAGHRQPFFQYVITLGYFLFPNIPSLELQNIVWALIDLFAVWIHYLLGREVGGRRVGLLLAALVSVTKPTLVNCLSLQSPVTTPLSVGLMLLMTWRFYRRPDVRHALQWGAALAFGVYCYNAVRVFMGFLPFVALATVLWKHRQRTDRMYRVLGFGSLAVFCLLFFQVNRYIPPLGKILPGGNFITLAAVVVLGFLYLLHRKEEAPSSRHLSMVLTGIVFAVFLSFPLLRRDDFAMWTNGASIFNSANDLYPRGGMTLGFIWGCFVRGLNCAFHGFTDRHDMGFMNEPLYNLAAIPVVILGMLWALVRFDRISLFWAFCVFVGMLPFILSYDGHSCRFVGMVTPAFLLGALGIDAWWGTLRRAPNGRVWAFLGGLAIIAYGAWNAVAMDYRFYTKIKEHASTGFLVYQDMRKDAKTHRVYLSQEYTETDFYCLGTLADRHFDFYALLPDSSASIPVPPGEKVPNVAFYFSLLDKTLVKRLKRDFPEARVDPIRSRGDDPDTSETIIARAVIRAEDIQPLKDTAHPPLFYAVPVDPTHWRRWFFFIHAGLGMGAIAAEDWVAQLSAPVPIVLHLRPGWAMKTFLAPKDGYYRFSTTTPNITVLDVGEKEGVLKVHPVNYAPTRQEGSIRLKAGMHRIRLRTYFEAEIKFPDIQVVTPGETTPVLL